MMRRYQDAARTFSHILYFISRTKQYHTRSFQYDFIMKQNEQMYSLLAVCLSLSPQKIEDSVSATIREKQGEKLDQVQQGEKVEEIFSEWFQFSCPKFISPVPPNFEGVVNLHQEPYKHQHRIFIREVTHQMRIPIIRSYLKLYTSMDIAKLASFLGLEEAEVKYASATSPRIAKIPS